MMGVKKKPFCWSTDRSLTIDRDLDKTRSSDSALRVMASNPSGGQPWVELPYR